MFLKKITDYTYEDLKNDGWKNTNETDVNDRGSILYVGLNDKEFEKKKEGMQDWLNTCKKAEKRENSDFLYFFNEPWKMFCTSSLPVFFAMFESSDDAYDDDKKPIGYLAIAKNDPLKNVPESTESYARAIALQSEVEGFENKRIAAFLVNRMNVPYYDADETEGLGVSDEGLFDGQLDSTITASADDDFKFCKWAYGVTRISKVEKETLQMLED